MLSIMTEPAVVSTATGPIQGRFKDGVELYAGVPYAAPPVGDRRFRAPAAVEPWTDVRDATHFSPAAPQLPGEGLTSSNPLPWDEATCLALNVVTPAADGAGRPVMVWIHGGDFKHGMGAIPWYNGTNFAKNGDVVLVSINYRMGAFGFCRLDHLDESFRGSGLAGILDQVAALEWVRSNIASFGGNPDDVTIFGESAGAFSVATLMALPEAGGLFHKAILQSGSGQAVHTGAQASAVADRLMVAAGVTTVSELQAIDAAELLSMAADVEAADNRDLALANSAFYPSVDGDLLTDRPVDAIASGSSSRVPVLLGTNGDETRLWGMQTVDEDRLARVVSRYRPDADDAIAAYRADDADRSAGDLAVAISTDFSFRVPSVRLAEARAAAAAAPTWMYHFDWKSTSFGGALGSCHALEIPFVFDNLDQPGIAEFAGGDAPQALADTMHAVWIAFARTGSPVTDATPGWDPYVPESRIVQEFADDLTLLHNPGAVELGSWVGIR